MQTKMFVFIGVPNMNPAPTTDELQDRLQFQFSTTNKSLQFTKKDKLLTARHNDVSYYVSILDSKRELKDWLQMAKDFELSSDTTSLTGKAISDRYDKLRITKPNLYSETEYSIAETIFNAMKQFGQLDIISFQ
jgi:hypothetical protein